MKSAPTTKTRSQDKKYLFKGDTTHLTINLSISISLSLSLYIYIYIYIYIYKCLCSCTRVYAWVCVYISACVRVLSRRKERHEMFDFSTSCYPFLMLFIWKETLSFRSMTNRIQTKHELIPHCFSSLNIYFDRRSVKLVLQVFVSLKLRHEHTNTLTLIILLVFICQSISQ